MCRVLAFLAVALSMTGAHVSEAAAQCLEHAPAVTVQIHDYVHLPGEPLSAARGIVTRLYRNIGVTIEWRGVLQQDTRRSRHTPKQEPERPDLPVAQLTIIVLTP